MHRIKPQFLRIFFRKLWMVANIDSLFYPFSFYSMYLIFGPWFIGEIIRDEIGVVFSWGTFLGGKFLPGSMSYFYGFLHILTFNVPLLFIIGNAADYRFVNNGSKVVFHQIQSMVFGNPVTCRCLKNDPVLTAP